MKNIAILAVMAAVVPVAPALAGTVVIDQIGGGISMDSKFLGGSPQFVFGVPTPTFTNAALSAIHTDIAASGIVTDGFVTFVLAQTDAGLSFMGLVDDENAGGAFVGFTSKLGMSSTAVAGTPEFINDAGGDISTVVLGGGNENAFGDFRWDSVNKGDGFAWAGLVNGDTLSFDFNEIFAHPALPGPPPVPAETEPTSPGLAGPGLFQFLTWSGGAWSIVATGDFSVSDQFSFSVKVIPLPSTAGLAAVGLLGVAGIRRRRSV